MLIKSSTRFTGYLLVQMLLDAGAAWGAYFTGNLLGKRPAGSALKTDDGVFGTARTAGYLMLPSGSWRRGGISGQ